MGLHAVLMQPLYLIVRDERWIYVVLTHVIIVPCAEQLC